MADLATLAEIKARLELTDVDAARDAVISAWLLAAQQRLLDLTGFVLTAGTKTEQRTNVQLGRAFLMKYRPIVPRSADPSLAVVARARNLGSATQETVLSDAVDLYNGKIVLLSGDVGPTFPPSESNAPWLRWRSTIWPVVVFTYDVSAVPAEVAQILNRAVVEWAAWIWAVKPQSGRLQSFSAEKVSETYQNFTLNGSMPPIVSAMVGPLTRGTASLVF